MKKIRSTTDLELRQTKLKLREVELEKNIRKDLKDLRKSVSIFHHGKTILKKASEKFKEIFK